MCKKLFFVGWMDGWMVKGFMWKAVDWNRGHIYQNIGRSTSMVNLFLKSQGCLLENFIREDKIFFQSIEKVLVAIQGWVGWDVLIFS